LSRPVTDAGKAYLEDAVTSVSGNVYAFTDKLSPITIAAAMARLSRATYSLMVSLLPATATVVGVVVLAQIPSWLEVAGVGLVVGAVALHREVRG